MLEILWPNNTNVIRCGRTMSFNWCDLMSPIRFIRAAMPLSIILGWMFIWTLSLYYVLGPILRSNFKQLSTKRSPQLPMQASQLVEFCPLERPMCSNSSRNFISTLSSLLANLIQFNSTAWLKRWKGPSHFIIYLHEINIFHAANSLKRFELFHIPLILVHFLYVTKRFHCVPLILRITNSPKIFKF